MDKLGLIVDLGRKILSWPDGNWSEVLQRGSRGHYLLHIAEDPEHLRTHIRKITFFHLLQNIPLTLYWQLVKILGGLDKEPQPHIDETEDARIDMRKNVRPKMVQV